MNLIRNINYNHGFISEIIKPAIERFLSMDSPASKARNSASAQSNGLTVVGSGPTAAATVRALEKEITKNTDKYIPLTIISPNGAICGGEAFGPAGVTVKGLLCNMPASSMSVDENPHDFVNWLTEKGILLSQKPNQYYALRVDYGNYLSERMKESLSRMRRRGFIVRIVRASATAIRAHNDEVSIVLDNGDVVTSRSTILCMGGLESTLFNHDQELLNSGRLIKHAYPFEQFSTIPSNASILIIGSSLTQIDVNSSLDQFNHRGRRFATSRNGIFPSIRRAYDPHCKPNMLSREGIDREFALWGELTLDIVRTLWAADCRKFGVTENEINFCEAVQWSNQAELVTRLRRELQRVTVPDRRFSLLRAVCDDLPYIWDKLSTDERSKARKIISAFNSAAFPCPPENGEKLLKWLTSGILSVHGIRPKVSLTKSGVNITYSNGYSHNVDYVINASGLSYDIEDSDDPLICQMRSEGFIEAHPDGGIRVDFNTGEVISEKVIPGCIYVAGPLTKGTHLYTNSVEQNKRFATSAVQNILDHSIIARKSA